MPRSTILLSDLAGRIDTLRPECQRCGRSGALSVRRLIAEHGAGASLPSLRRLIAADCPQMTAGKQYDACGIRFPQLAELF